MNRNEKIAWFTLAVCLVSVVLYFILFTLLKTKFGMAKSAHIAFSAFSLVALSAFGPLLFRKRRNKPSRDQGERNSGTWKKGLGSPYLLFWLAYGIVFLGYWFWVKFVGHGSIGDVMNVVLLFVYIGIFCLVAMLIMLNIKQQSRSTLVADEQKMGDVIIYGPNMDERDLIISRTARWSGFVFFWIVYVFGFIGVWAWLQFRGYTTITIDISVLPLMVFSAFILILVVDAITTIVLYRRGE